MEISSYIIAPIIAWAVTQTVKYLIQARKASSFRDLSYFYKSGNMPSSHSALMLALLTVIGVKDGTGTVQFAIVFVLSMIVIYDAVNVRRAVGEQGLVIQELAKEAKIKTSFHIAMGHQLTEVAVGIFIGIASAIVVLQFI